MNPNEILKVISKQWCSLEDLKKLTGLGKNNLLKLKRVITRLQASVNLPIHFYEALDDEYRDVYQSVINDNFKIR